MCVKKSKMLKRRPTFRIDWELLLSGRKGEGAPLFYTSAGAQYWCDELNKRFPSVTHWVTEEVVE